MPFINVLPKNVAELIAAGEVVERPASVIKELVENSIDAGAKLITVEIKNGGITYIRVTDNGCGIESQEVPTAFLRHATSKIKTDTDLDSIATLGFRGEALAAVSSVARVEMLTAKKGAASGTHYKIEGSNEILFEESGCPEGTTIVIRDLFFNTPARMKFLKKDVSEANACAAVVDRIALSHPEIAFKFIRDGKITLSTSGDGNIKSAVYSVLGREFSSTLMDIKPTELEGISVSGLVCKPVNCKPTRNNQFIFLNGRLVRSGTVVAAAEQAFKNSAMIGKFPAFVIYVNVPFNTVDVNVHPAKTEVRFSDEKRIFNAVYTAIKTTLISSDTRPEINLKTPEFNRFEHMTTEEFRQQAIKTEETVAEKIYNQKPKEYEYKPQQNILLSGSGFDFAKKTSYVMPDGSESKALSKEEAAEEFKEEIFTPASEPKTEISVPKIKEPINVDIEKEAQEEPEIKIIGEAFSTYIVAEMSDSVFLIDKHAAHERILFNQLKQKHKIEIQPLLMPVSVVLVKEEYDAVINNLELLEESGFEIEDFGASTVVVRAVPAILVDEDISALISEISASLTLSGKPQTEREERLFHTVSCKAAIKAGTKISLLEMESLARKVLCSKEIMYCPHGRPVAFEIKRRELEKQFGRIQ
ncbi:MAG: DNA mismatch repair endonuclease MutL [Ruminococcaceae bacterium]|nr:DNA mismatch repair endonuclease MutL [Oscillospiraceae bacterium]